MPSDHESKQTAPLLFKPHPWHGITAGEEAPQYVNAFIEIVPTDTVKYEIDKHSGYLKVERPQKFSNYCPALYGFIPQTYCGTRVAEFCKTHTNHTDIIGDGDPLDICVLSERPITHGDIIVKVKPIAGIRMIDKMQADDKIIAVVHNDDLYGSWNNLGDFPKALLDRLLHYFLTYKEIPNCKNPQVEISTVYDQKETLQVIAASMQDYNAEFGDLKERL